jgi:hypothetical protein
LESEWLIPSSFVVLPLCIYVCSRVFAREWYLLSFAVVSQIGEDFGGHQEIVLRRVSGKETHNGVAGF